MHVYVHSSMMIPFPPDGLAEGGVVVVPVHRHVDGAVEDHTYELQRLAVLDPRPRHEEDHRVMVYVQREVRRRAALQQLRARSRRVNSTCDSWDATWRDRATLRLGGWTGTCSTVSPSS